jgi:hypothetical protein
MNLYEKIIEIHPELTNEDFWLPFGAIELRDDSNGNGAYIYKWDHPTLPRPTDEQLAAVEE